MAGPDGDVVIGAVATEGPQPHAPVLQTCQQPVGQHRPLVGGLTLTDGTLHPGPLIGWP